MSTCNVIFLIDSHIFLWTRTSFKLFKMNFSLVFLSRLQLSFQSGSVEDEKSGKIGIFFLSRQMTRPWHWTDASVQRNGEGEVAVETARPGYDMMRVISESGLKYLGSESLHHCAYFEPKLMNSRCYRIHKRSCWLKAKLKQRTKCMFCAQLSSSQPNHHRKML